VRSEVLNRVKQMGKEIHKRLEQYGFCMNWGDQGKTTVHHPLIRMLCEKIAYSEKAAGLLTAEFGDVESFIWPRYFRKNSREELDPKVLFDLTWYRPRDLVRLCQIMTEIAGDSEGVTESLLGRIKKRYALESWNEIESQLTLAIDPIAIIGLESVLTSFKAEFKLEELEARISSLAGMDPKVERLRRKHRTTEIVAALYANGAVGDFEKGQKRFSFRGDADPNFEGTIVVHRGLLPRFSLKKEGRSSPPSPPVPAHAPKGTRF